jgi:Mce-associated membrane protein
MPPARSLGRSPKTAPSGETAASAPATKRPRADEPAADDAQERAAVSEPADREPVEEDLGQETEIGDDVAAPTAPRRHRVPLPAVLGVLTVPLGGLAVWSGVQASTLTSASAARNTALTDSAATTEIVGQISGTVNDIFSYNYSDPVRTRQAARQELTGAAVRQYQGIFRTMQQDASRYRQLVLTTAVTNAGVEMLEGNRARVLIFGNQVITSASQAPQSFGAMVALDLVQQGGTWKIDNIDTFTGNP